MSATVKQFYLHHGLMQSAIQEKSFFSDFLVSFKLEQAT
jgi:hypothetical protein